MWRTLPTYPHADVFMAKSPHCPCTPFVLFLASALAFQAGKLRHGAPGPIGSVGTTAAGPLMLLSAK